LKNTTGTCGEVVDVKGREMRVGACQQRLGTTELVFAIIM
jgi:hypothetical protein